MLLGLYAFSLAAMQPTVLLFGFSAVANDLVFLGLAAVWAGTVAVGRARLARDPAFAFVALYLAALLLSLAASSDKAASAAKVATQLYLFALPVVVCSLVEDLKTLRAVVLAWLAGTALVVLVAILSLALFAVDPAHPLLNYTRFPFGTLPPGPYPRLQLTFGNANMACNYLAVSLALLLGARRAGWIGRPTAWIMGVGITGAAVTTFSPGFGGMLGLIAVWAWLERREQAPLWPRLVLGAGLLAGLLFWLATMVTPILHPTAPFLIRVPGADLVLAPSPRLMIWIEAMANFAEHPVTGRGIGIDAVAVDYLDPSGRLQHLTDAHQMFLNIAVQAGAVGLAALVALLWHMARRTMPFRLAPDDAGVMRLAIGLGLLGGLVYQGLSGSFEDSRHLWFAFGLLLAASRIEARRRSPGDSPNPSDAPPPRPGGV